MRLFLLTFFLIYGGIHLFGFVKLNYALSLSLRANVPIGLFMMIMILSPWLIRVVDRSEHVVLARIFAHVGYFWMGFLFLFFAASVFIDGYRLLVCLAKAISGKGLSVLVISAPVSFFIPLLLAVLCSIYGYFAALNIRTEHVLIPTAKMPAGIARIRIVQISDVHMGLIVQQERLERILQKVQKAGPDLLVSTGDLVDGQGRHLPDMMDMFRRIRPLYGKYAVTGNHEFYAGLDYAVDLTEKGGFVMLRGRGVTIAGLLNIAGVDDPAGKYSGLGLYVPEKEILSALPRKYFTVLLKHQPQVDQGALGLFDLQLSGHTHNGQIFPFNFAVRRFFPLVTGTIRLLDHAWLHVSRGSGTWGPPIRFLSPPEVTVIDLMNS